MSDEPLGTTHAEPAELGALRRRAYGPDADIIDDAVALARLSELEEGFRRERAARAAETARRHRDDAGPHVVEATIDTEVAQSELPSPAAPPHPPPASPRARRWRVPLLTGATVVVGVIAAVVWSEGQSAQAPEARYAKTAAVALSQRAHSYEAGYELYLDGLRDKLLSGPGMDEIAARMIHEQLRPYGTLFGRTVGAGPTVDDEFCMIVSDLPEPSITCISIENAYANPVSVILPAWYSNADSDVFTGLGEPISYTLLPGGGVVAEQAGPRDAAAPAAPAGSPDPEPAPVRPPGWGH